MSVDVQRLKDAIQLLKNNNLLKSQKEIAEKTDYNYITISEILNKKQPLSEKFVKTFARAYSLNPKHWSHYLNHILFQKVQERRI